MKTLLFIVLSSFACASVYAKPPVKTLFSCTTTNGKQLTMQRQGTEYIYIQFRPKRTAGIGVSQFKTTGSLAKL